jgi:hypothetical protein
MVQALHQVSPRRCEADSVHDAAGPWRRTRCWQSTASRCTRLPCLCWPAGAASAHTRGCTRAAAASSLVAPRQVSSFGVGGHVKLPGPSAAEPNVYTFGTPYAVILDDLQRKDADLYTRNRLLQARPQPAAQYQTPLAQSINSTRLAWRPACCPPRVQRSAGHGFVVLCLAPRAPCPASRTWLLCSTAGTCARRCCTATLA